MCFLSDNVIVYFGNQSIIHLCKSPKFHENTKHVDVRLYFIRYIISQNLIKLEKVHLDYNPIDMGTKVLLLVKFKSWLILLNIDKCMWRFHFV